MASEIVNSTSRLAQPQLRSASPELAKLPGTPLDLPDATTFDLEWLANWIRKLEGERGMKTKQIAKICHTQSPRISQLKVIGNKTPPSVELLWRLMTILHDEQEWADLPARSIRAILFRAVVSIGPSRMHYLASLSTSDAQAMIDDHQRKAASRKRLSAMDPTRDEPSEKR